MEPESLTVAILEDIRDEMRGMRGEMNEMRGDIHAMRGDIASMDARLGHVEGAVVDLAGQVRMMGRARGVSRVRNRRQDERLDELERRVSDLERRG